MLVLVCPGTINDVGERRGVRTGVWLVHINYTTFITTAEGDKAGSGLLLGVFVLRRNQNNLGGKPLIVVILTIVTAVTLTKPHQTLTGSEMFYSQHSVLLLQFTGRFSICLCLNKKPAQKTGKGEVGDLI